MGNCCGCLEADEQQERVSSKNAFQGEGHRLGTADEAAHLAGPVSNTMDRQDDLPDPVYNPNLTDDERARIRADRAAAAEARLKKQAGGQKPKKKTSNSAPLVGPNSQPTMRWTSG